MYNQRYAGTTKTPSEFRILDNGVAEGQTVQPTMLARCAQATRADELVIPDVMNNVDATLAAGKRFVEDIRGFSWIYPPKFAAVVQGRNPSQWQKCINAYFYWAEFANVTTLMFPRCMNTIDDNRDRRVKYLESILRSKWWEELQSIKEVQIHCLGASQWVSEALVLSDIPQIRSMDTSLPIVLGLEGIQIEKGVYVKRQSDYFNIHQVDRGLLEVIRHNVRTYREWAKDEETPTSKLRELRSE